MSKDPEKIELEIESLAFEGSAVARKEGLVYFVKGGLPGEIVIANIKKRKKNYIEAETVEILRPSELRSEPKCRYFGVCGGCSWQDLDYKSQLEWKGRHIRDAFEHIARCDNVNISPTLASPKIYGYRNKMEFSFGASRWLLPEEIASGADIEQKDFALGLHSRKRFDKVIDIKECFLHPESGNELLSAVRKKALELQITAYESRAHTGFLRNLILRYSKYSGEILSILVTNTPINENENEFVNWYFADFPKVNSDAASIVWAVNDTRSPVAWGDKVRIAGKNYIEEQILGLKFKISPQSFFQTNSSQLAQFISKIIESAELKGKETVWDLYCGAGTITLPAARKCKLSIGMEISESAIADAKNNASRNSLENALFFAYDLHSSKAKDFLSALPMPDVMIIDPPRAGMHPSLARHITEISPPLLVYVSCNPATQARDAAAMATHYRLERIQPVDMFPHTYHVESIAVFRRI